MNLILLLMILAPTYPWKTDRIIKQPAYIHIKQSNIDPYADPYDDYWDIPYDLREE